MLLLGAALLALLALLARAAGASDESGLSQDASDALVRSLRRQIMRDNSDYSLEKSRTSEKIHMRADAEMDELTKTTHRHNYYMTTTSDAKKIDYQNHNFAQEILEIPKKIKAEHPISEKDLLYYVDEEKLISKNSKGKKYRKNRRVLDNTNMDDVTYTMLKVRHQHRRSGQNRYIQEEGKHGVALVSVDRGPFPELRLPRARRQYQHGRGAALSDDREVPPPAVATSDPEAAADDK